MNLCSVDKMKDVDVRTVDLASLVDITEIKIDESMPKEERIKEYQIVYIYFIWSYPGFLVLKCGFE